MANAFYTSALTGIIEGSIRPLSQTIKVLAIKSGLYSFSASHDNLDDIAASARIGTATLGTKTVASGAFDAADTTIANATGATCSALVLYVDSGTESTSALIFYFDAFTPVSSNPVNIVFDAGASKIYRAA